MNKLKITLLIITGVLSSFNMAKDNNLNNYSLQQAIILSRSGIRTPLSESKNILNKVTNHRWQKNKGELTTKGLDLEKKISFYITKELENEKLFSSNKCEEIDKINVYSNNTKRSIETANQFISNLKSDCNIENNYSKSLIKVKDKLFSNKITKISDEFLEKSNKEINQSKGYSNLNELVDTLKPSLKKMEEVLNIEKSYVCKNLDICDLDIKETKVILELNKEPKIKGELNLASKISDAIISEYYDKNNNEVLGKKLHKKEYNSISKVKDIYDEIIYSSYMVSSNVSNNLVKYLKEELEKEESKLLYLSGNNSNLLSIMTVLGIEDFKLIDSVENKNPMGSKLILKKYKNIKENKEYIDIKFIYLSDKQIKDNEKLDLNNKPIVIDLYIKDIQKNEDRLYKLEDIINRLNKSIKVYENIKGE